MAYQATTPSPTPWKADGSDRSTATWVEDANGKRVCTMIKGENDWDNAESIAAAVTAMDKPVFQSAEVMLRALKRAALLLAELPAETQDSRMKSLRSQIVEAVKIADPKHYGITVAEHARIVQAVSQSRDSVTLPDRMIKAARRVSAAGGAS